MSIELVTICVLWFIIGMILFTCISPGRYGVARPWKLSLFSFIVGGPLMLALSIGIYLFALIKTDKISLKINEWLER